MSFVVGTEIIITILCIFMEIINIHHFLQKRRESKRTEQLFFIYAFTIYVFISIAELALYLLNVPEKVFVYFAYTWFTFIVTGLAAAGLTLVPKFKSAIAVNLSGLIIVIIELILFFSGKYDIDTLHEMITIGIFSIFLPYGMILGLILVYFTFQTRMSQIIGLTAAIGLLGAFALVSHILLLVHGRNIVRLIMLIIMYLGFKRKFSWFEWTTEQKIKKGMPVMVEEYDEYQRKISGTNPNNSTSEIVYSKNNEENRKN